jgi:hypothetical protein
VVAIVERLTRQLRSKGNKNAKGMAIRLLKKHGLLSKSGKLTAKGKKRNSMSPSQRAKARAAKYSGNSTKKYKYSKRTNRATLKKKNRGGKK